MPRRAAGLTALKVKTALPGRYGDGGGLYLLVRPSGARFWMFRWTVRGRMREAGLGAASGPNVVTLASARAKAAELRAAVRAGRDPIAEKAAARRATQAAPSARTFAAVASLYIEAHEAGWRSSKHAAQWRSTLQQHAACLADVPIDKITTGDVMNVLEPLWRRVPETASRLRGRIEAIIDYATAREWRLGDNPARWRGHLSNLLPARSKVAAVRHHAALPWRDIGGFMRELEAQPGIGAMALRLLVLTAARSGEVRGMTWSEIDFSTGVWTIPGTRMKAGRQHRVPLSAAALDVLRGMRVGEPPPNALAFPSPMRAAPTPLSDMTLAAVLKRMGCGDLTAHGFRSTFRDWCAEATNTPRELAEAALAHTLRDKVEAAYQRRDMFDRRRLLMDAWANFCTGGASGATVVQMRRTENA